MILTTETLQQAGDIVTIIGSLISVLLIIIGFFLKSLISEIRETRDIVIKLAANFTSQDQRCLSLHKIIDERLKIHSDTNNKQDIEIAILKGKP